MYAGISEGSMGFQWKGDIEYMLISQLDFYDHDWSEMDMKVMDNVYMELVDN